MPSGIKYTTETFLEKVKEKGLYDKYDFSNFDYNDKDENGKIKIKCRKHGIFLIHPSHFLNGRGCRKCYDESLVKTHNQYVEDISKIRNDIEVIETYIKSSTPITHRCKLCGNEWKISPHNVLINEKCPICGDKQRVLKRIEEETKKRNYTFECFCDKEGNEIEYKGMIYTFLKLKCNKCGNIWSTTSCNNFLNGGYGCSKCKASKIEMDIENLLKENNIEFVQYNKTILNGLELDFYLPQYKTAIECQGIQHFVSKDFFGGQEEFKKLFKRDNKKKQLCDENGIKLLYYSNLKIDYPYKVFENKKELLNEILK